MSTKAQECLRVSEDKGAITTPFKIRQYSTEDLNEETGEWKHHLHTDVYYQGELIKSHITDY